MIPPYNQEPYKSNRCVQCLEKDIPLTKEHIFADGAGGYLVAFILCETCNGHFGRNIDAPYLQQPIVQLARNAYRIGGRRNVIPQPFKGPYTVPGPSGDTRVVLDIDFKPYVLTKSDDIEVIDNDSIQFAVLVDASDRSKIPEIIRSKLERFFKSERGLALNWTSEEQEREILSSINKHMTAPEEETPVGMLSGRFTIDLGTRFLEAAKVAYEIACIESGDTFIESAKADAFRKLLQSVKNGRIDSIPTFEQMLQAFQAVPLPHESAVFTGIQYLVNGKAHQHHVALVNDQHIVVSMFGDGYIFADIRPGGGPNAIYTNDAETGSVGYLRT